MTAAAVKWVVDAALPVGGTPSSVLPIPPKALVEAVGATIADLHEGDETGE